MIKTLIVSGCSVAHGCETHSGFMHEKNIENSFSHQLAQKLQCNLRNVAQSGCSNDYIFFSTMKEIEKITDIHSVIVSWTALSRLTWENKNRLWMFIANWATSVEKTSDNKFADWKKNIEFNNTWYNSDRVEDIETLKLLHQFFLQNYLDDYQTLSQRLRFYSQSLNAVCYQKNIKLVEVTPFDLGSSISAYRYGVGQPWSSQMRHPNKEEHIYIAKELFDKYYNH